MRQSCSFSQIYQLPLAPHNVTLIDETVIALVVVLLILTVVMLIRRATES